MDRAQSPTCAAPFVAMEFDQFGDVQACCANALYPLGNVATATLEEIWHGPRAVALRKAVLRNDLSYGCGVCRHRLDHAYGELPRDYYDGFPFTSTDPAWPYSLQFSLHNTCNLECVMCGADRSSKIRSRRTHLEPLPHAYGESFFEQLPPFLEHCGAADFSGGEPFLVPEHVRVWELLAQLPTRPLCSLTTNGTVWNERVERALDQLDFHIAVSIDGVTPSTLEQIRVGARHEEVMRNLDRFATYTAERGTQLTITFSLVRQNWFELGAMLRFAEERGISVKVQTVIEPEYGVQRLPDADLAFVVESLRIEGEDLRPHLARNAHMWDREVARLADELDRRRSPEPEAVYLEPPGPDNINRVAAAMRESSTPGRRRLVPLRRRRDPVEESLAELRDWAFGGPTGTIRLDAAGRIVDASVDPVLGPGFDRVSIGGTISDLLVAVERSLDAAMWIGEEYRSGDRMHHTLWFGRPVRDKVGLVIRTISTDGPAGRTVAFAADRSLLPGGGDLDRGAVPVSLGARRDRVAAERD